MPSIEGIAQNNLVGNLGSTEYTKNTAQTGHLSSMSVQITEDPISSVQDSAEELTFARDNSKKTKLSDRKQKQLSDSIKARIEKFKTIVATLSHSDSTTQKRLYDNWSKSKAKSSQIKQDLEKLGGHPSSNYAYLLNLIDDCEDDSLKEQLQTAANDIYKEQQSQIVAALNAIEVSTQYSLDTPIELSQTYAKVSHEFKDPLEIIGFIKDKYGVDKLQAGLDFLFKALGADLNSSLKSQDTILLESLGSSLSRAKELNGALRIVQDFVDRLHNVHDINTKNLNSLTILEKLVDSSKKRFVTSIAIRDVYKEIPRQNVEKEVLMAQELMQAVRNLSLDVFPDLEARTRLVEGIQKHIDECVDREDEYLANL